tara:strand:- start:627 stop:1166 length:540 start_codon:yes stop_codon:yes gene_type:complete
MRQIVKSLAEIKIIITGGTLDKSYNQITGELAFENSIVPELIQHARFQNKIQIETPFLIDSLEMTELHRNQLIRCIKNSSQTKILITHGTDTIIETAQVLENFNDSADNLSKKTIILTGAMVPARVVGSDAEFNLGASMLSLNSLESGVYMCFQGQIFNPKDCIKDKSLGLFKNKLSQN